MEDFRDAKSADFLCEVGNVLFHCNTIEINNQNKLQCFCVSALSCVKGMHNLYVS